jgi:hypothetical protein
LGEAACAVSVGVAWLDLPSVEQDVRSSFVGAVSATVPCLPDRRCQSRDRIRVVAVADPLGYRTDARCSPGCVVAS